MFAQLNPIPVEGAPRSEQPVPIPTEPVFNPERYLIEKGGDLAIWFALMLFLIKNLNIGTLIARWAEMPSRIGQLAQSVESLAGGLKESNTANNSEHREFRDSLKDQSHALSNIEHDLTELKAELRRRLDN